MKPADETKIAEFYNDAALWTPTVIDNWDRPFDVGLTKVLIAEDPKRRLGLNALATATDCGGPLKVSGLLFRRNAENTEPRKANPPPELLERFLSLSSGTDETILKFAKRFGPLEIYSEPGPDRGDIEYCEVWRYFARSMLALLKIAARVNAGNPGSKEDWDTIGAVPRVMTDRCRLLEDHEMEARHEDEYVWFAMTRFVARGKDRDQKMLVRFLDRLLGLGRVRPWVRWPKNALRPRLIYSSPGLLPYLALQLCLRATKMDAFVLCAHCQKEYTPSERKPKTRQRNFCPECREAGIPKKYALSDYRNRKRSTARGTKETRTK
jgi:hypothetical protein